MFSKLKLIAQILVYTLILGIGGWIFYTPLRTPLPLPQEAPHLLTVATEAEHLTPQALPSACYAPMVPFHQCARAFVQFISEKHPSGYRIRTYRLFPATLSILFLLLIPALGLKRRGGCFETEDTPHWIALFVITTPPFLCYGSLFLPLSFQTLLFLGLLISFRAYVQWPGYLSSLVIALLIALSISIDAGMAWIVLLMVPAIAIGVGWRRMRLYWRGGHFLSFSLLLVGALLSGYLLRLLSPLPMPTLQPLLTEPLAELTWRFIWLTAGGFGFIAWIGLSCWSHYHLDRRWPKVLTVMFPLFFIGSLFFSQSGAIAVATMSLSLLLLGMALSIIPSWRLRLLIGGSALIALTFSMPHFVRNHFAPYQTAQEQRLIAKTLLDVSRPNNAWKQVALSIRDRQLCARLAWPIRQSVLRPTAHAHEAEVCITDQPPMPMTDVASGAVPTLNLPGYAPIYVIPTSTQKVTQ